MVTLLETLTVVTELTFCEQSISTLIDDFAQILQSHFLPLPSEGKLSFNSLEEYRILSLKHSRLFSLFSLPAPFCDENQAWRFSSKLSLRLSACCWVFSLLMMQRLLLLAGFILLKDLLPSPQSINAIWQNKAQWLWLGFDTMKDRNAGDKKWLFSFICTLICTKTLKHL